MDAGYRNSFKIGLQLDGVRDPDSNCPEDGTMYLHAWEARESCSMPVPVLMGDPQSSPWVSILKWRSNFG